MENNLKVKVQNALCEWIDPANSERSAKKLEAKSGVSNSYISHIMNGKYSIGTTVIKEIYFRKLADAIGLSLEEEIHEDTENFKFVQKICMKAQQKKAIVLLDSVDSGLGKTYSLEYAATYHDKMLYIKCTSSMTSKDLLDEILHKLMIRDVPKGMKSKIDLIKEKVLGGGYLIIIDELEDVKIGVYKTIKEIIDFTYNKCGVLVSGMGLIEKIEKLSKRNRAGFPQLKRRLFPNRAVLQYMSNEEKIAICRRHDINLKSAHVWFTQHVHDMQSFTQYLKDLFDFCKSERTAGRDVNIDGELLGELFGTL